MPISKIVLDNQSKENVDFDGEFVRVPHGTTAQRPSSPAAGQLRFNTDLGTLEQYNTNTNNWAAIDSPPIISSLAYSGSNTATDPAGGETITLTGSNFKTGFTVTVGGSSAASTTFVNSTTVRFTTPAKTAGDYDVTFTNANGLAATLTNGISVNGVPAFSTAAGNVGSVIEDEAISTITIVAAEPDGGTLAYSITSGALPTGLSLGSANGQITGTPNANVTADTTFNFTVTATDDENQTNSRAFNLIVIRPVYIKEIDQSVKFGWNANAQTLQKTLSGTHSTWTISMWIKSTHDHNSGNTVVRYLMSGTGGGGIGVFTEVRDSNAIDARGCINTYSSASSGRGPGSEFRFMDSEWTHIVLTSNSLAAKLYVNGVEDSTYGGENFDAALSGTLRLLNWVDDGYTFFSHLAEVHFISGTAYAPSNFGQLYNDTWIPKEVTLTTANYGADGFHLDFADASALGNDVSGNNNDCTTNMVTSAGSYCKHDSPTKSAMVLQSYSGTASRYRNKWGSYLYSAYEGGGGTATGNYQYAHGQFSLPPSGKWYFEVMQKNHFGANNDSMAGIIATDSLREHGFESNHVVTGFTNHSAYGIRMYGYGTDYYKYIKGDGQTDGSNVTSVVEDQIFGCAIDLDNGRMWWSKGGTWLDGDPAAGTGAPITFNPNNNSANSNYGNGKEDKTRRWTPFGYTTRSADGSNGSYLIFNFGWIGGGDAAHSNYRLDGFNYAPPTGFNRMSKNLLPDQTAFTPKLGAHPSNHFSVATYVGDGTVNNTKTIATECQPDMVWIKSRDSAYGWRIFTPTFKSGNDLKPYYTHVATGGHAANYSNNDSIQVNSSNFTLGDVADSGSSGDGRGGINQSGQDYVALYWKLGGTPVTNPNGSISSTISVNTTTQVSNVLYNTTNSAGTIGHGLNGAPDVAIYSEVTGTSNYNHWMWVRHASGTAGGSGFFSGLNTDDSWASSPTMFTSASSTTVGLPGNPGQYGNESGKQFNAIFFKEVEGFSKFGFYKGNAGNSTPPEIKTGFKPKFVLVKKFSGSGTDGHWVLWTDQTDTTLNERPYYFNLSNADAAATSRGIYMMSDGFRLNNYGSPIQDTNKLDDSYFFMAFAAHPTEYSFGGPFSDFGTATNLT